jgi:hypothetical protein
MSNSYARFSLLLLLFCLLGNAALKAQCLTYTSDWPICKYSNNTFTAISLNPCSGGCTYTWPTNPFPNVSLVSGQGSQTATYYFGNYNFYTQQGIQVMQYDIALSCSSLLNVSFKLPNFYEPVISGTIPACPSPVATYKYACTRYQNTPGHTESLSWTPNGGTIINTTSSMTPITVTDTVYVQWNGAAPFSLKVRNYGIDNNFVNNVCAYYDTVFAAGGNPVIVGQTPVCTGANQTYTTTNDPGFTYSWAITNGSIASGQGTSSVTVNWTSTGVLTLTKTNTTCGTVYTATKTVTYAAPPAPNLGPNTSFCQNSGFTLNAGAGQSYAWSTGATTPTITPLGSGTYSVTVTNSPTCSGSSSVTLTMLPAPFPTVSLSPANPCAGQPVTMNAGIWAAYQWSTGATTSSITVTNSGIYSVTVTDFSGCSGSSGPITLVFSPVTIPNLGPNQTVCNTNPTTLNAGNFSSYLWSTGATTQTISVNTSGTYSVTVTNSGGCTSADTVTVTYLPPATPNLGPNQNVCQGTPITLNPGTFTTYAWSTGATTPTISPTTSGNYTVTVTSSNGCTASDVITVTFQPAPVPQLGNDTTLCFVSPLILNPGAFSSYLWNTGAVTPTLLAATSGTYDVRVTNGSGCVGRDTISITYLPTPTFSLGADSFICADTSTILLGPAGASSYLWSTGATTQNITVNATGTYSLTATHSNGCVASDDKIITGLTDCVFPGDANYDGVANNQDILAIGVYYGTTGPGRSSPNTLWYGQNCTNWGGALPGSADPKHSDCSGNGTVTASDTAAVPFNYGRTHTKMNAVNTAGANFRVVALQDSVHAGALAWFALMLGDSLNQADSVYGLAFSVNYNTVAIASPGLVTVDYSNCWFAANGVRLDLTYNFSPSPEADLAVVRNDQAQQLGFGEVCRIAILTDSNMVSQNASLVVGLTNVFMVDATLGPQAVAVFSDSTVVSHSVTQVNGSTPLLAPRVFPNPADDRLRIEQLGATLQGIELFDAQGRIIIRQSLQSSSNAEISTASVPAGVYILRIVSDAGVYHHRICVRH